MESNKALVKSLRKFSPRLNKLVDRALEQGITIIMRDEFIKAFSKYYGGFDERDRHIVLSAANFPEADLGKVIIVSLADNLDDIDKGNLGRVEFSFAHEIVHNLTWEQKPYCAKVPYSKMPRIFRCAYFEILADKGALQILDELIKEQDDEKFMFDGLCVKAIDILGSYGLPGLYVDRSLSCPALEAHSLQVCPKANEILKLAKQIKEFDTI